MPRFTLIAALVLSLAAATAPARAETERITVMVDGLERELYLTVPDGLTTPAPLVLALHGLLETGKSMQQRVARGRFDVFAERYGFVVAYPSAWGRVWNLGEGEGAAQLRPHRDDMAFLDRSLAEVRKRVTIDPDRIFIAGYSMGGMVGLGFACKRPGLVRAIGIVASALPKMFMDDCLRHMPDGVVIINGTDDDVVPFEGGMVPSGPLALMELASFDQALRYFTQVKRCRGAPREKDWDAKSDRTSVHRSAWYNCRGGAVEGYRIEGGGHRWPSGGPVLLVTGRTTREIEGTAAVWGFFSRFR